MNDRYKELIEKYPGLFHLEKKMGSLAPFTHRGIECGPGWLVLLDTLCSQIVNYDKGRLRSDPDAHPLHVEQIKEKYGTLRFYLSSSDDYIKGIISMAEGMSAHICEECGEKGIVQSMSWIKTLCHECYHNWEAVRKSKWNT